MSPAAAGYPGSTCTTIARMPSAGKRPSAPVEVAGRLPCRPPHQCRSARADFDNRWFLIFVRGDGHGFGGIRSASSSATRPGHPAAHRQPSASLHFLLCGAATILLHVRCVRPRHSGGQGCRFAKHIRYDRSPERDAPPTSRFRAATSRSFFRHCRLWFQSWRLACAAVGSR